jgi:hypothetical protein
LFTEREKVALRYADAITWDPTRADDALWAQLTQHFTGSTHSTCGMATWRPNRRLAIGRSSRRKTDDNDPTHNCADGNAIT